VVLIRDRQAQYQPTSKQIGDMIDFDVKRLRFLNVIKELKKEDDHSALCANH
jgi:hypothetical protein